MNRAEFDKIMTRLYKGVREHFLDKDAPKKKEEIKVKSNLPRRGSIKEAIVIHS